MGISSIRSSGRGSDVGGSTSGLQSRQLQKRIAALLGGISYEL
jgi:hypothetical protein